MNWDTIQGILRAILSALAGVAVTKGYIDSSTATEASGAIIVLATAAWSCVHKAQLKAAAPKA